MERVRWTPEMIASYWDFQSRADLHGHYFSKMAGLGLALFVQKHLPELGEVIDYGCGPGYLLEHLLELGGRCWALDSSPDSLAQVERKFSSHPGFLGAIRLDGSERGRVADTVFCIETLEHVLPERQGEMLATLRNHLRPGGHLVLTVPNEEVLERSDIFCPRCHAVFHRWQHLTSWSEKKLQEVMESHGFQTRFCGQADLWTLTQEEEQRRARARAPWTHRLGKAFLDVIDTREHVKSVWRAARSLVGNGAPKEERLPNLVYVGARRG